MSPWWSILLAEKSLAGICLPKCPYLFIEFQHFGEIWSKSPRIPSKTLGFCPQEMLISQEHERQGSLPRESPLLCGHGTGGGGSEVWICDDLWIVLVVLGLKWLSKKLSIYIHGFYICFHIVRYISIYIYFDMFYSFKNYGRSSCFIASSFLL